MPNRSIVHTDNAPQAIGTYSQAVKVENTVYLSGQIPLIPDTMEMVEGGFKDQARQMFKNLRAVCEEAGGDLGSIVKLNLYLTDLDNFPLLNEVMTEFFDAPYPARAAIGISQLPKAAMVEADGVAIIA